MKKIYLSILSLALFSLLANAQVSKGSLWLGGNIGFNTSKDEMPPELKQTNLFISPGIGIAFSQNLVTGIQLNINFSESNSGALDRSSSYYGADLFLRRYWDLFNRLYAFAHFRAGYTAIDEEIKGVDYLQEINGWSASMGVSPGLSFALNKRFHLESSFNNLLYLAYTQRQTEITNSLGQGTYGSHNIAGGISLENVSYFNFGFRLLINK